MMRAPTSGDFLQERHEENGSYLNRCCECSDIFMGHKGRVVCRDCLDSNKDQRMTEIEEQRDKWKRMVAECHEMIDERDKRIAKLEEQLAHKDKVISQIETEMSFYTEESSTARYMLRFIAEAKAKESK